MDTDQQAGVTDLVVLALLCANAVKSAPNLSSFSAFLHMPSGFWGDVLGGVAGATQIVLIGVYAFLMVTRRQGAMGARLAIVWIACALVVVLPTLSDMTARHLWGLRSGDRVASFPHDGGVLQTEAAVRFLIAGQNPYAANYGQTEMALSHHSDPRMWESWGLRENPAYSFLPYPPLNLVVSTLCYLVVHGLSGWYDQRVVYLLALAALSVLAWKLPADPRLRVMSMALFVLGPWAVPFLIQGYNDVGCVLCVVGAMIALRDDRPRAAGAWVALACGAKQFAWFLAPLYLAWLWSRIRTQPGPDRVRLLLRDLAPCAAISAILFVPFLAWDPAALFRSLVVAQNSEYPFRIMGLGFSNVLAAIGALKEPMAHFPLGLFHLVLTLPVLGWGIYRTAKGAGLPFLLQVYALTLLIFLFCSRHFAPNYFWLPLAAFVGSLIVCPPARAATR